MSILVTGSIAYDTLLHYGEAFNQHLLPEHLNNLSVAFVIDSIEKRFGGCAGNIAFHGKQLKLPIIPVGSVGKDFGDYHDWLVKYLVSVEYIKVFDDCYTAQAIVSTDIKNNQITFFYPGAMARAGECTFDCFSDLEVRLGCVSPNDKKAMLYFADQFSTHHIPFVFDPGQALPVLEKAELITLVNQADYLILNTYESALLLEKMNTTVEALLISLKALIITQGAKGADLYVNGEPVQHFDAISIENVVDPTGCGDAFRAGLLYGLYHQCSWVHTLQLASLMGGLNACYHGTQSDQFSSTDIQNYFVKHFGHQLLK